MTEIREDVHTEWTDDVVEWCGVTLQELSHSARDWNNWQKMVKPALDVNGHWAHDLWWWVIKKLYKIIITAPCHCMGRYSQSMMSRCPSVRLSGVMLMDCNIPDLQMDWHCWFQRLCILGRYGAIEIVLLLLLLLWSHTLGYLEFYYTIN